jgi:hypothetical protein
MLYDTIDPLHAMQKDLCGLFSGPKDVASSLILMSEEV